MYKENIEASTNTLNTKLFEVFHRAYGDSSIIGIFTDTEDNIKSFVDKLNNDNKWYYQADEDENDSDIENYFSYYEIKPVSVEEYLSSVQKRNNKNVMTDTELINMLIEVGVSESELKKLGL